MAHRLTTLYAIIATLLLGVVLFTAFQSNDHGDSAEKSPHIPKKAEGNADDGKLPQVIRSVDVDRNYTFAGEPVPSDNFDALERLDRELSVNSYWHSSTLLNIKASARYFPVIEPILAEHGVPDDFKFLAVTESNLRNVTSPAGAKGIWQFLKTTGAHYGLEINGQVDERYHIEKATEAACKYLKEYHEKFGSWTLAAAGYNMGGPRLAKAMQEQKAESYYDLNVNDETSRYIFRIIAMKEILSDPEKYGFYIEDSELYKPLEFRSVSLSDKAVNWADFAQEHGISYRMLKVYNPWLVSASLANAREKEYEIKLPID